jgi:hypothetical protein
MKLAILRKLEFKHKFIVHEFVPGRMEKPGASDAVGSLGHHKGGR